MFDKYTPLPEGELKAEIEALAGEIGFPTYQLLVVEGSKRSLSVGPAYFYGFFRFKRIVLLDALLNTSPNEEENEESEKEKEENEESEKEKEENEESDKEIEENEEEDSKLSFEDSKNPEILAIVGHELGHWQKNHVSKRMIIAQVKLSSAPSLKIRKCFLLDVHNKAKYFRLDLFKYLNS